MRPSALKYTLAYLVPLAVAVSIGLASAWSFAAVAFIFGLLPAIELVMPPDPRNMDALQEDLAREDRLYDLILHSMVPIQWGLLVYFLHQLSDQPALAWTAKLGMTTAFGMACGVLGINAAHELGHRPTKHEQFMAKALLLTTLYMHFFIEHNRGHHKNVSTDDDPASSRRGEWLYSFFLRTITGSWMSAWSLEAARLRKKSLRPWGWRNEMLRFQLMQAGLVVSIALVCGPEVMAWFLGAALIGILLLETVNYIEHYGLRRKRNGDTYERPLPIHSWNSDHPLGRLLLLELTRHSDHHYLASRKYQVLRHFDESPQLPAGYPAMMALAFLPPLWFRVMDRELDRLKASSGGEALA